MRLMGSFQTKTIHGTSVSGVSRTSGSATWVSEAMGRPSAWTDSVRNDTETLCCRLVVFAYHPYDE